jgi:plasmid stability protein
MAQILVRNLDPKLVKRLKAQAKRHGRSLESEARTILESSAKYTAEEVHEMFDTWHKTWNGRIFSDSTELIREDRDR